MSKLTEFVSGLLSKKGVNTSNMSDAELTDAAQEYFNTQSTIEDRLAKLESAEKNDVDTSSFATKEDLASQNEVIEATAKAVSTVTELAGTISEELESVKGSVANILGEEKSQEQHNNNATMFTLEQAAAKIAKIKEDKAKASMTSATAADLGIGE